MVIEVPESDFDIETIDSILSMWRGNLKMILQIRILSCVVLALITLVLVTTGKISFMVASYLSFGFALWQAHKSIPVLRQRIIDLDADRARSEELNRFVLRFDIEKFIDPEEIDRWASLNGEGDIHRSFDRYNNIISFPNEEMRVNFMLTFL